ncbi:rhodanese-like domain-containing protein [Bacteroidota bacterium]
MSNKKKYFLFIIISGFCLAACLNDNIVEPMNFELLNSVELLVYLENRGDIYNSIDNPFLVEASELYSNLNSYLIIDIRPNADFNRGHISEAINLGHSDLLEYLNTIETNVYSKIVIVSTTGQAASYYTCLLRIYGFDNIYCLQFGMASWHTDFAGTWLDAIGSTNKLSRFNNIEYPKSESGSFPNLTVNPVSETFESILEDRITFLLDENFIDTLHNSTDSRSIHFDNAIQLTEGEYIDGNVYLVCFGHPSFYRLQQIVERLVDDEFIRTVDSSGHHPGTVLYSGISPYYELRSDGFLHTLPSEKTIVIYSYNGHLSAAAAAYLNLLGYNAKSVLFGGNNMFIIRMTDPEYHSSVWLNQYVFKIENVANYIYSTN